MPHDIEKIATEVENQIKRGPALEGTDAHFRYASLAYLHTKQALSAQPASTVFVLVETQRRSGYEPIVSVGGVYATRELAEAKKADNEKHAPNRFTFAIVERIVEGKIT